MSLQAVNDSNFESEVINSDTVVLVDFWAEWCGPCKSLMPIIEDVAADMKDKIKIVKMNIEEAPETPTKYGLRGVPTLMLFKDGKIIDTHIGGMQKSQLSAWLSEKI